MYRLTSTWHLPAPPEVVWDAVEGVAGWPAWWPGVAAASIIQPSGPEGLGQRIHLLVRSPLGYRLSFGVEILEAEPPRSARARVVGDLVGEGHWSVEPEAAGCVATIRWHVSPARAPLRWLSPRCLATWAHSQVMQAGERGLVTHLTRSDT